MWINTKNCEAGIMGEREPGCERCWMYGSLNGSEWKSEWVWGIMDVRIAIDHASIASCVNDIFIQIKNLFYFLSKSVHQRIQSIGYPGIALTPMSNKRHVVPHGTNLDLNGPYQLAGFRTSCYIRIWRSLWTFMKLKHGPYSLLKVKQILHSQKSSKIKN